MSELNKALDHKFNLQKMSQPLKIKYGLSCYLLINNCNILLLVFCYINFIYYD